jgi:hypothetical protein
MQSRFLLISEIALTFVLLVGASLMIRSFVRLIGVDAGIDADSLLTFKVAPAPSKYPNASQVAAFQDEMLSRIRALPGVKAASTTDALPMRDGGVNNDFASSGAHPAIRPGNARIGAGIPVLLRHCSRLMRGRFLSAADTAADLPACGHASWRASSGRTLTRLANRSVSLCQRTQLSASSDIKQSGLSDRFATKSMSRRTV